MANNYPTDEDLEEETSQLACPADGQKKKKPRFLSAPEWWLAEAIKRVGYRSVVISLLLWRQLYYLHGQQPVMLTAKNLRRLGVNRQYARRVLFALERARLIKLERFLHRSPLITIITDRSIIERSGRRAQIRAVK
jgi:hypothetical protein